MEFTPSCSLAELLCPTCRLDHISRLFADYDGWRICIPRCHTRHDRCIDHTESLHTIDTQCGVNYGHRVYAHHAGTYLVMVRDNGLPDIAFEIFFTDGVWARIEFTPVPFIQSLRRTYLAAHLQCPHQGIHVGRHREVVGMNLQRNRWISRGQLQEAPAGRANVPRHQRVPICRSRHARHIDGNMEEQRLEVGTGEPVVARPEQLAVHRLETGHWWGHPLLRCVDEGRKRVIMQILADPWQIDQDIHA